MIDLKQYEVWFITGSQHLYGPKRLKQSPNTRAKLPEPSAIRAYASEGGLQTGADHAESIRELCLEAN